MIRRAVLVVLLLILSTASSAFAADHDHVVRVRKSRVYVDGQVRWRGKAVLSDPVWSERGDAIAFTGRDRKGRARLVVILVSDAIEPTAFSWPVPASAQPAVAVTWLGEGRVGAGPSELHPRMVAEFTLE